MKNMKLVSLGLIGFLTAQVSLIACNSPKQREVVVEAELKPNLVAIADVHEATSNKSSAYYYKDTENAEIQKTDSTEQRKIDADVQKILSKVQLEATKKDLTEHLDHAGLIALVITADRIEIYKVITDEAAAKEAKPISTIAEIRKLKKETLAAKMVRPETFSSDDGKGEKASDSDDKAGLNDKAELNNATNIVKITAINITTGVLENKKTKYYEEKMSVLTLVERPFDLSTHIQLGTEEGAEAPKPKE